MSARVLLVRPWSRRIPTVVPSLGLGYLAAVLRGAGHEVTIHDGMRERTTPAGFRHWLSTRSFDVVGFQSFTCDLPQTRELSRIARGRLPAATLLLGGPHASADPAHALAYLTDVDFAFRGEAERGLVELLAALGAARPPESVENLARRAGDGVECAPVRFIEDLDAVPFPAWDLTPPRDYPPAPHGLVAGAFPVAPFLVTRGCPYLCTFCDAVSTAGRRLRVRSMENVVAEIDQLVRDHGIREIHLEDDNFTTNRHVVRAFCEALLERGNPVTWCCPNGMRLDTVDRELLALMRRAGLVAFAVGIESGSRRVLESMHKDLDLERTREKLAIARSLGIKTTGFFIVGFPGETEEDVRETVDLSLSLDLDHAQFSNFLPLPGTRASEGIAVHDGSKAAWSEFLTTGGRGAAAVGFDVAAWQRRAFLRFYLRPRTLVRVLAQVREWAHFRYMMSRAWRVFA